ncbi:regulator of G-protein signaling 8 isoform X1 [Rana temporaria]|uniref:regulator of G-protein signaling 8 isoform X1 n=1 Tax=Rana temporaria TaxID=8407 RepID=UPI001AADF3CF|nr:regulator of G-protein signaling 8 isoform X1 [Rana temporaria]
MQAAPNTCFTLPDQTPRGGLTGLKLSCHTNEDRRLGVGGITSQAGVCPLWIMHQSTKLRSHSLSCPTRTTDEMDAALGGHGTEKLPRPCGSNLGRSRGIRTHLSCLSQKSDSLSDFSTLQCDTKHNQALKTSKPRIMYIFRSHRRLTVEEARRWARSFDLLLSHKYGRSAFRAFLQTEFSEENLEFWMACEEYRKTRSINKLPAKARHIFQEFIDVQAPREVNIDFPTREMTKRNLQHPSLSCFDLAQLRVRSLMERDSYPRFLRSQIYNDLLSHTQKSPC